jgi:hypothetical protein
MKNRTIERQYTLLADFYYSLYAIVPIAFVSGALASRGGLPLSAVGASVVALTAVLLVGRHVYVAGLLKQHAASLTTVAELRGWQVKPPEVFPEEIGAAFSRMSLSLLATHGQRYVNCVVSSQWAYADWAYDYYQQTKNGEYKAAAIYYGVMSAQLPRIMPNVFFDSKSERGRQFKAQFAADQRHSLEGDFDQYFDTYFAEGYTIDALSFITPDVMLALRDAAAYDIEIVGDRVLLYGPMYVDATQLDDMAAKLAAIQTQLAENVNTYRDDRLPVDLGRQTVTPLGMSLQRPRLNARATVAAVLAVATIYLLLWLHA